MTFEDWFKKRFEKEFGFVPKIVSDEPCDLLLEFWNSEKKEATPNVGSATEMLPPSGKNGSTNLLN